MKAKKVASLFLATTLLIVSAVGCGNVNEEEKQVENSGEKIPVRVYSHKELADVMEPFVEEFEKNNSDIDIQMLYDVDQLSQMDTNEPLDLLYFGDTEVERMKDKLLDLKPLLEDYYNNKNSKDYSSYEEFTDSFIGTSLEALTVEEELKILPVNCNVSLLYYNEDLFDAEKLEYPTDDWTYTDYVEAGKKLTKKDSDAYSQWGCTTTFGWWGEWLVYCRQYGGDFYEEDSRTTAFNTAAFQKGIDFYKNKMTDEENKFAVNPYSTSFGESDLGGFPGGMVAMDFGGHTGNWASLRGMENLNWNVAMLPTPDENPDAKGSEFAVEGYGIYSASEHPEEALRVLTAMFEIENQKEFGDNGRLLPTTIYKEYVLSVPYEERQAPKNMEAVFEQMEYAVALPKNPNFAASAQAPICDEIEKYVLGEYSSYEEFAAAAQKSVEDYVATVE